MADLSRRRRPNAAETRVPTWEEIAHEQGRFLYSVAYRLTGNHNEAQDLVQDVLLRVERGLKTYRPGNIEGWLGRITTNVFLDGMRQKKRRPTDPLPQDNPERVLPTSPSADEDLAASVLPDHIQLALSELPEDFRVVVVLSDVVGSSYADIANQLKIPLGTVRSRLHRGRLLMRDALSDVLDD
ncbi:MAG: sigma-70 family RNA polymerase sigma factor [Acidimicrobiales bacterium]